MRLIFIRHAEPDYSIDSLTEKGWREAKLLAERTKRWILLLAAWQGEGYCFVYAEGMRQGGSDM